MSKLKNELLARKAQVQKQLKTYDELVAELAELNKALAALEPDKYNARCYDCSGCSICRNGPDYR